MEVIKHLNKYGLDKLQAEYAIKVTEDSERNLYVLNYDQINSPKNHPITNECRSLVVSFENDKWFVVSRSFDRFFNYGEIQGDNHDITKMVAYEKVDGSIVSLFYWQGEWIYRTRSMIMPTSQVNGWDKTWKELIEPVLLDKGFHDCLHNTKLTYIFEVVGIENRVVTRYDESAAYLLAVRENGTGRYCSRARLQSHADMRGWKLPKRYTFDTIEHCLQAAKDLRDLNEGYVLYDHFGVPKIKVKNPAYVAAHLLRGEGLNPKRIMQLMFMNEVAEYLSIFPEDTDHFAPYQMSYGNLQHDCLSAYHLYNKTEDQKEFAMKVKDYCYSGVLFSARKQNKKPLEVLHSMDESYKIKLLTQYMEEK